MCIVNLNMGSAYGCDRTALEKVDRAGAAVAARASGRNVRAKEDMLIWTETAGGLRRWQRIEETQMKCKPQKQPFLSRRASHLAISLEGDDEACIRSTVFISARLSFGEHC